MPPPDEATVALRSIHQLPGRHVQSVTPRGLAAMRKAGVKADHWWRVRPEEMAERDLKFFSARDGHNRWPELALFTCQAVVRGRRCSRISLAETGYRHCTRHAGPHYSRIYRENQRKLFECGRLPAAKWFRDEARRMRTAIRDRQRRKRDGWMLPGITLRFSDVIEQRFRADVQPLLPHPWSDTPDLYRDQLRWAWRRFMLDRQKPAAWDGKARAILLDLRSRGPFDGAVLEHASGLEPHVLQCSRRATAFDWRSRLSQAEIDRAIKSPTAAPKATRRGNALPGSPTTTQAGEGSDQGVCDQLLARHGRDLRELLCRVDEAAWPELLAAYDAYVADPTIERHRRWMLIWQSSAA